MSEYDDVADRSIDENEANKPQVSDEIKTCWEDPEYQCIKGNVEN